MGGPPDAADHRTHHNQRPQPGNDHPTGRNLLDIVILIAFQPRQAIAIVEIKALVVAR